MRTKIPQIQGVAKIKKKRKQMELRLKKIFKLEQKELSKQLSHHTASRGLEDAVSDSGSQGPHQGKKLSESFRIFCNV